MILEPIKSALIKYRSIVNDSEKEFETTKDSVFSIYNSTVANEKLGKARKDFDNKIMDSKLNVRRITDDTLSKVRDSINSVITEPIPNDFLPTLKTLETIQNPTKTEIDTLVGKYKDNYLCYRAICDHVGGVFAGYSPVKIEDVLSKIHEVKTKVEQGLDSNVNSFTYTMLADSVVLDNYSHFFEDFLSGSFDDITKELDKEKQNKNFVD